MRFLSICLMLCITAAVSAHEFTAGSLFIDHPWSRPSVSPTGAVFFTIRNDGHGADNLVSAKADMADRVELHRTEAEGTVMRMVRQTTVPIPAGEMVTFEPGGLHVMLLGLKDRLAEGDRFPVTLTFERAGTIEVEVVVEPFGYGGEVADHDHHNH